MRIGINALFQARGGSLTNLRLLLREWERSGVLRRNRVVMFTGMRDLAAGGEALAGIETVIIPQADGSLRGRMVAEQLILPKLLRSYRPDVLFCPANTMPLSTKISSVTTFQNAAPFCDRMSLGRIGARHWVRFRALRTLMRLSARRSVRTIFGSNYFRQLFRERYGLEHDKGIVIYRARLDDEVPAEHKGTVEARHDIRQPYLLSVSHFYPYKNLLELVAGFAASRRQGACRDAQLVLVGDGDDWYMERVLRAAKRHGVSADLRCPGEIAHDDVRALFAGCALNIFSSTCENCPTALIEALSVGVPIACSRVGVMPEIAGTAPVYFDPYSVDDVAGALQKLWGDPELRRMSGLRGRAEAQRMPTASEMAAQTFAVLETSAQ